MRRLVAITLLLIAAGLLSYVIWRLDTEPRTDDAYVLADTISVTPEINGRIIELPVRDNQAVKKGDILFRIDPRPFELALGKAQATLTALDNEIKLTQRSVNSQQLGAAASKSNIDRAKAAAQQATDTLERMRPLLSNGYVAAEQIDQAETAKKSAQSQLKTAILDADRAQAAVSGVDALVAKRDIIQSEIAMAKLNLEYATVRAPFDGNIIGLRISSGQYVAAGHPIFTLSNTGRWYVVANFRETELANITPGHPVLLYLLSDPSKRFHGVVESIGSGVFPEEGGNDVAGLPRVPRSINWVRVAQRFPVRILVKNPDPAQFRIGASAVAMMSKDAAGTAP